jgi:glycosyltransferase involved in cell wall biosynthesis
MKKLLYITDQDEYIDHSFITPLFERYLKAYMEVDILYFSDFKSDFTRKDNHRFIMPSCDKGKLLRTLEYHGVKIDYDFVIVRNDVGLMKQIIDARDRYGYKALYRFSYPKATFRLYRDKIKKKSSLLAPLKHHFMVQNKISVINQSDGLLPTSIAMKELFLPHVDVPVIVCPPAIDPTMVVANEQHTGQEKRFIYEGTIDGTRDFETILRAFAKVRTEHWHLTILTRNRSHLDALLEDFGSITSRISISEAKNKTQLQAQIASADIGVALLPNVPIYNSSLPVKIFDYYTSGVPCLMTRSAYTNAIFEDNANAWFSDFEVDAIAKRIEALISMSKEEVSEVGAKGQAYLLEKRNYETIAKEIATALEERV